MNEFDRLAEPRRCGARNRQTKTPCQLWAAPFQQRCPKHGANTARAREKARKAAVQYEMFGSDPAWRKAERLRRYEASTRRWEMRRAKKRGPQAVLQLKAHWKAEDDAKKAWIEDGKRARLERREQEKREWRERHNPATPPALTPYDEDEPSRVIPWDLGTDMDWSDLL